MASAPPVSNEAPEKTIFGHPRALYVLFFAELWERFCYYGMRALLALYVVAQFQKPQAEASVSYGAFTALVYATGIFGGSIADRLLGYGRSIMLGGTIMAVGMFMLMVPNETVFLFGLATIIVGNGLFKPNISTLVGKLYPQGDPRRDGGFTIFYMGINVGAFLAPIACESISRYMGTPANEALGLAAQPDYRYGFLLAGLGMILGIVCFGLGGKLLRGKGEAPAHRRGFLTLFQVALGCAVAVPAVYALLGRSEWTGVILYSFFTAILMYLLVIAFQQERTVRERMMVLVLLLLCNVTFWMCFEQAGNSLNFFARDHIDPLRIGEWTMPFEWFQSVNAIMIVTLGPVFAWMWVALHKRGMNPSIPAKFGLGLIQVALGFALLIFGIDSVGTSDGASGFIPWYFLAGLYLIHTSGELCISPVGLSMVTKLAPEKITGMVMGAWFMAIAVGNNLAGDVSGGAGKMIDEAIKLNLPLTERIAMYATAYRPILYTALGIGVALLLLSRWINKWMHGVR